MPKSIDAAKRRSIISDRQNGMSLLNLSAKYHVSYVSVQTLCKRYKDSGDCGLKPYYDKCGKKRLDGTNFIYRSVRCLKTWHPSWGAEKIRQEILLHRPDVIVPPARTLQDWFRYNRQNKAKSKVPSSEPCWAKNTHEGWQIDAKEEMKTLDGVQNTWLNIKDEKSGAVIDPPVFPL